MKRKLYIAIIVVAAAFLLKNIILAAEGKTQAPFQGSKQMEREIELLERELSLQRELNKLLRDASRVTNGVQSDVRVPQAVLEETRRLGTVDGQIEARCRNIERAINRSKELQAKTTFVRDKFNDVKKRGLDVEVEQMRAEKYSKEMELDDLGIIYEKLVKRNGMLTDIYIYYGRGL